VFEIDECFGHVRKLNNHYHKKKKKWKTPIVEKIIECRCLGIYERTCGSTDRERRSDV